MQYLSISGLEKQASRIVFGTAWITPDRREQALKLIDSYVTAGGNFFDTARIYGDFTSEDVFAEWLKVHQSDRDKYVILTKGCHHEKSKHGEYPTHSRVSPDHIKSDLAKSLEHLKVDYVDIYLLHRDDTSVPVSDLMDALEAQRRSGKIRAYGVSNWTYERIEEANKYCASKGYQGISVNSPAFSLAEAAIPVYPTTVYLTRSDLLRFKELPNVTNVVWSSQAQGFFGRTEEQMKTLSPSYKTPQNFEKKKRAEHIAELRGRERYTPTAIALAYVLAQPLSLCAVIGGTSEKYLHESLSALSVKLTDKEIAWLSLETDTLE